MKFPQDTTQNKVSSMLLPAVFNQAGDGLATQSKRGFAESLRHQISVVAETSRQVVKTDKHDASRPSDFNKSEKHTRGTDLPVREQKLPRDSDDGLDRDTAESATSDSSVKTREKTDSAAQPERAVLQDGPGQNSDFADPDAKTVQTVQDTPASSPAHEPATSDDVAIADGQAPEDELIATQPQSSGVAQGPTKTSELPEPTFIHEGVLTDPLTNGSRQNPATVSPASGSLAVTLVQDSLLTLADTDSDSSSTVSFLAASGLTSVVTGKTSPATPVLPTESADELLPQAWLSPTQSSSQKLVGAVGHSGLFQSGLGNTPLQNQHNLQPGSPQFIIAPDSGQQTALAAAAVTSDLFNDMLQSDVNVGDTAGGELSFSNKLLSHKPALPTSLQYASMLSQSGQPPGVIADNPMANSLSQSLVSGQLAFDAGVDTAALSTLSAGAGASSNATSGSASGLSAALYSQEQRQQAAAEARNVQVQNSRGLDTSLNTTSALKLPGLEITFGQAGWADRLGRQMLLQSAQGSSSAQIRLDPPELGSLTVKIQLVDQSAAVNFVSPHAMVRDALEQQAGRLQEMFREQGMDLLDVSVSDQSAHSDGGDQRNSNGSGGGTSTWLAEDNMVSAPGTRQSESLIDYYA